jgi:hypothetical protein
MLWLGAQDQAAQIQYFQLLQLRAVAVAATLEIAVMGMALLVVLVAAAAQIQVQLPMVAQEYQDKDMLVELMEVQAPRHTVRVVAAALEVLEETEMLEAYPVMVA